MAGCCSTTPKFDGQSRGFRRVLIIVLLLNAAMFVVEMGAGLAAGSMALKADALDFLGDSVTYALTLAVIGQALAWRARAAIFKGLSLGALGLWVLGATVWRVFVEGNPEPLVMGSVGLLACAVNVAAALLLLRYRDGDSNVRSVWLCSRNDAIGNLAVILAAVGVALSGSQWPDLAVAALLAGLFLQSSARILSQASEELRSLRTLPQPGE
ncbi:cation transporter [Algihabitans albus]|uniref:cation transporter n=1 Tax=Algihabitans albus TaxID=2164067 RepID=UPI000E5C8518|nr:cation transporter [Algihabitans albus]